MSEIVFTQGSVDLLEKCKEEKEKLKLIQDRVRNFFNLKNVNFLFGSGTSAGAIPTMSDLYKGFKGSLSTDSASLEVFKTIEAKANKSLEACLQTLYAAEAYYKGITLSVDDDSEKQTEYSSLKEKIEEYIFNKINIDFDNCSKETKDALDLYKLFYQKIALRNKDNSRIRVFTTNNDLFNETAMDALSIHYINGFSGGLHRFFNPAFFNYTLSKRMDTSIDKYEPVENLVYLYKIHGSVNWRESELMMNNYFHIEEVRPRKEDGSNNGVLIYPTPTKQDKSLGSPYVDLFREFQHKLLEPQSVLFVIGYSFSDQHVNDVIYRALATNSTLNVVVLGEKPNDDGKKTKPIFYVSDNRIFTISGTTKNDQGNDVMIHYFEYFVEQILPDLDASKSEDHIIEEFIKKLNNIEKSPANNEDRKDNIG